jgi:hypothetical protein
VEWSSTNAADISVSRLARLETLPTTSTLIGNQGTGREASEHRGTVFSVGDRDLLRACACARVRACARAHVRECVCACARLCVHSFIARHWHALGVPRLHQIGSHPPIL